MKTGTGFFEESPNNYSMSRLILAYSFLLIGFIVVFQLLSGKPIDYEIVIILISGGAGLKAVQKPFETKQSIPEENELKG